MLTLKSSEEEFQWLKYEKENSKSPPGKGLHPLLLMATPFPAKGVALASKGCSPFEELSEGLLGGVIHLLLRII